MAPLEAHDVLDTVLNRDRFLRESFLTNAVYISKDETLAQVRCLFMQLKPYAGVNVEPAAAAQNLLAAYLVYFHPFEAFELQNRERVALRELAAAVLDATQYLAATLPNSKQRQTLDEERGDHLRRSLTTFYDSLERFTTSFQAFRPKNHSLLIKHMVDQYITIEKRYLTDINREDLVGQDFLTGYRGQLDNLASKINRLGGARGLARLEKARERLAEEREQEVLYHTRFKDIYHLRALDPQFTLKFTPNSKHTQQVRSKAQAALASMPPDSAVLFALFSELRDKMKTFKEIKSEVKRELDDTLSDEQLRLLSSDLGHEASRAMLAYVRTKISDWSERNYRAIFDAMFANDLKTALPEFLAVVHDELDHQRIGFINMTLAATAPGMVAAWERQRFEEKLANYQIHLHETRRSVDALIKEPRHIPLPQAGLFSQQSGEWLLANLILDLLSPRSGDSRLALPETLLVEKSRLMAFQAQAAELLHAFTILFFLDNEELRRLKVTLNSDTITAIRAELNRCARIPTQQAGIACATTFLTQWLESLGGDPGELAERGSAARALTFAHKPTSPLSIYVRQKAVVYFTQFLQRGAITATRPHELERAFAQALTELGEPLRPLLHHNMQVHGERYHQLISLSALYKQLQLFFGSSTSPAASAAPVFSPQEVQHLSAIKDKMTWLANLLNGLTLVRQTLFFSSIAIDKHHISDSTLLSEADAVGLLDVHLSATSRQDRLLTLAERLITKQATQTPSHAAASTTADAPNSAEGSIDVGLAEEVDLRKLRRLLKRNESTGVSYHAFYDYLCDSLLVAARHGNVASPQSHSLAVHFTKEMRELHESFMRFLDAFHKRQSTADGSARLLYEAPLVLRAGRL